MRQVSTREPGALLALCLLLTGGGVWVPQASAEPFFAIDTGQKCSGCHTNPTGGGLRTTFGNVYTQTTMPARPASGFWDPKLGDRVSVGANARFDATATSVPDGDDDLSFDFQNALAYLYVDLIPQKLAFYLDERLAPGGATNREAYALVKLAGGKAYVKAGRMFLPYGWRIQDDDEFIRQVPGINYNTPDDGVEAGLELARASINLALSNGTAGGGEVDRGKQFSLRGSYIRQRWRAGASLNINDAEGGKRQMQNVFAGVKTGPVIWMGEVDYVIDDGSPTGRRKQWIGFLEANALVRRGHNLKLTWGWFDPDDDVSEDERNRYSLVYEYTPIAFMQLRTGVRINEGIPQSPQQNTDVFFLQLHGYF